MVGFQIYKQHRQNKNNPCTLKQASYLLLWPTNFRRQAGKQNQHLNRRTLSQDTKEARIVSGLSLRTPGQQRSGCKGRAQIHRPERPRQVQLMRPAVGVRASGPGSAAPGRRKRQSRGTSSILSPAGRFQKPKGQWRSSEVSNTPRSAAAAPSRYGASRNPRLG